MTPDEFTSVYDAHADAIYRHCAYRVSDTEIAADLTQDTFLRAWDYIAKGHSIEQMRAFLFRIANNLIINHYKKKKSASLDVLMEGGFDPASTENVAQEFETEKDVLRLLEQLPQTDRDVLVMRFIDGLGPKDISSITGQSENAVSAALTRAMKKVRTLLPHP